MTDARSRGGLPSGVWLAALAGLILRLAFALAYWVDQPLTRDEREYLALARGIAAGRGFVADPALASDDPFGRAPGYPAFLSLLGVGGAVPVSVPAVVKVAQSVVGAGGVVLVAMIALRLAGTRAARAAAWIAAAYPPLVWLSAYALSEAIFWPIALAAAWLFDRAATGELRRGARDGLIAGLVLGAAMLVRPGFLLFAPIAAFWLMSHRRGTACAALALGACLVVLPWTARNYAHHGRVVLIASEGGVTFWTGNHPLAGGDGDLAANPDLKRANLALRAAHANLTEEQMEPIYYREALTWMRAHPLAWVWLECRKMFYLVVPIGPSYRLHSMRYYAASLVSFGMLAPLGAAGWVRLRGRRSVAPGVFLAAAAGVIGCLIFFSQERFRIVTVDPALVVSAAALWRDRGGARA